MKLKLLTAALLAFALVAAGLSFPSDKPAKAAADAPPPATSKVPATSVSTFHCLSIYWSPEGGEAKKQVLVKFRQTGEQTWHEGLPMRYNPVKNFKLPEEKLVQCKADYRGSIVNLTPGTSYEIALTLEGTETMTSLKAATWSEKFPVASTVTCHNSNTTLNVNQSGTPEGYILYDGTGSTIDTANKSDMGIDVNAHYVILRGFTIKNVKSNGINITKGDHIVIENCDVSKWGSEDPAFPGLGFGIEQQGGVFSKDRGLHALVIQRCKFHNPTWNTNSWAQKHHTFHPDGPQTIVFTDPEGNIVIRYNECWSDDKHYFNDTMGGNFNGSYLGWPGADSDIYCNYIANCWDDGIEVEGGGQNIRIWNNYIEHTMMMIANAATSIGPLYIWQNVTGASYDPPGNPYEMKHGNFMKMGFAGTADWMTGHMYVFNNTIYQGPNNDASDGPGGDSRVIKHCVTRNNIFNSRPTDKNSISTDKRNTDDDFDYDLISHRVPADSEKHGIKGLPKYLAGDGFNFETKTGNFQQAPDSPGVGKAVIIPNFCDSSAKPDMGAQQSGTAPMIYGVKAEFIPPTPH